MYNKRKYLKSDDKRILHKVKKQWVIVSLALLMVIGGGSLVTYADTTNSSVNPQIIMQENRSNQIYTDSKQSTSSDIMSRTNHLHAQLANNSTSSNVVDHNLGAVRPIKLTEQTQANPFTGNYTTGKLYGMNYKDYTENKALEFTDGQANKLNWFYYVLPQENTQYIKFDDIDASYINNMYSMFANDTNVKSIDLSGLHNTENVTNMFGLFRNDSNLQSVKLPNNFNATNVSDMSSIFQDATSLNNVSLSGLHTSNKLKNISWMFSGSGITHITFPDSFDTSGVTNMSGLFGWTPLEYLNLPESFDTHNVSNMANMFTKTVLQKIIIQSPNTKLTNADLPLLYRENSNDTFSSQPNNFQNVTTGTFVDGSTAYPSSNPNKEIAEDKPSVLDDKYNQNIHFNSPQGQNNDIESIIPHYTNRKIDYWDIYYLWNPDPNNPYPFAFDEWGHAVTRDFNTFEPVDTNDPTSLNNVAIPDPQYAIDGHNRIEVMSSDAHVLPWNQVAGGSVISNHKQDGGQWITHDMWGNPISPNARLAYFANFEPGNMDCYLAYSNPTNNSMYEQFRPYNESIIFGRFTVGLSKMDDFRDPFVTINPKNHNQLVAYCAGGSSKLVYILTSSDAVHWSYTNKINLQLPINTIIGGAGNDEAPYVTQINDTPIILFSTQLVTGKGKEALAYMTGKFDNHGLFYIDNSSKFGTVDQGFDVYADNLTRLDNTHLLFLGWLGNWGYSLVDHLGDFSLPRILSWNGNDVDVTPIEPSVPNQSDKISGTNNQYQPMGK